MCKIDLPLWRLRSLVYSTTVIFYSGADRSADRNAKKLKIKKEKRKDKKMLERGIEQRIYGDSYPMTSRENVLSEWIPFNFSHRKLMFIHLKEDFAAGIRPSDDGAIFAPSSQLCPVHLHIKIIK